MLNQKYFRRLGALVDHNGNRSDQPVPGEQSLQKPGQARRKQPPNEHSQPMKIGVVFYETRESSPHSCFSTIGTLGVQ
jgi:hypothetical protein